MRSSRISQPQKRKISLRRKESLIQKCVLFLKHRFTPIPKKKVLYVSPLPVLKSPHKSARLHIPLFHLPRLPYRIRLFFLKVKYFIFGLGIAGFVGLLYLTQSAVNSLPNPAYLTTRDIPATTKLYDRNGKLLYEIYQEENRTPLPLNEIPENVKQATIAIEDSEFYDHQGLSVKGITRAFFHNMTTDSVEGGSTITQQLIRSALLTPERTVTRKIKEIVLSLWAERQYSKDQILEMYLNQVPYGGTAWGIEAASQTYFGKSVKDLTLGEAALLAGLPAAPSIYSPFQNSSLAKSRQEEVLNRMVQTGYITEKTAKDASDESLSFRKPMIPIAAPHFVMYVRDYLEQNYGRRMVEQGGLRVTTTLDLSLQEKTQNIVREEVDKLANLSVGNGATLITDPKNGQILAMVGSRDYFDSNGGNVNLTTSLRQPGSSVKVITYSAALSKGFTAASVLDDSPVVYRNTSGTSYSPVNYDGRYHGQVALRTALASSYNIPAVKVLNQIGVDTMINLGRQMGIKTWTDPDRYGLSLTLGGGEVTMLEMATVYGTLANTGTTVTLSPLLKVTNWKGDTIPLPEQQTTQSVSPEVSFIISNILSDNTARTPAFGPNSTLVIPNRTVSVKTGTSDYKRDNWTIGYTPDYVVTVWVGNNDNRPMNPTLASGVTGAAPIWSRIMTSLLENTPDKPFIPPEKVIGIPCYGRTEYFIRGTEPKGGCPILRPLITITPTPKP